MSYDIRLQTQRGKRFSRHEAKAILDTLDDETNLNGPCEVIDLWEEPDAFDVETLEGCFLEGEFSRSEYEAFCSDRGLTPEGNEVVAYEAARLFLDFQQGQALVLLCLPREKEEVREAYRLIVEFARRHNLVLLDPQVGEDIDLENPGEFPPMW